MSKITNKSENYKGSLLERADKEGWKVTVLKPQGKQDEQFIMDKFRDDFWEMFVKPDKNIIAKGGEINGDGESALENIGDGEDMEEAVYSDMAVEIYLSELTPRERNLAELRLEGYSNQEIAERTNTTENAIKQVFKRMKRHF